MQKPREHQILLLLRTQSQLLAEPKRQIRHLLMMVCNLVADQVAGVCEANQQIVHTDLSLVNIRHAPISSLCVFLMLLVKLYNFRHRFYNAFDNFTPINYSRTA
ncbi:hypothetical protein SDC9_206612 [bioreactor metagenome]|uniref:Uncharacterized protein n=1 Tax=bioreactor metagenome TaxID=1076179 RepID=A0A645J614_9ZZZZ